MDALELLDELEDIIDKGASVPFSGRCILERDELLDVLQELKLKLPEDLKQAKWIKEERQRILQEAQAEADEIIKTVEKKAVSMVDENEITKQAIAQGKQIVERAQAEAQAISDSAYNYSDNLLETVEKVVLGSMKEMEQCVAIVRNNRSELRGGHEQQVPTALPEEEA
ncbi:ATP synthase subunit B family protein [Ructibacterium gallinarum]|uniref:ATPase n=1 Tax=Ructibacterium gallinarum TaxID=2779355 RepID=A0A9D5RBT7_9FIRM|nr:ATPase [Ructibacterium gallinarum]MBE5040348.1 ATPase [Ructibacterium gallinarum]